MKTSFAAIADRFVRAFMMRSARVARYVGERRVTIQIVVGAVAGMLGFWGWTRHNPPADLSGWFDNVFRTAQLVTLQFPTHLDQGVGWRLQIARLLVPAVALFATINVLVGAITRPARLALARFTEDHMIVCGQAQLTEAALKSLAKRGRQIITVGPSVDAARREALEDFGLAIIEADPFQPVTFRALNLAHASALILTHVDDLENVELAMLAIAAAEKRGDDMLPLVLAAMIGSEDLARELDLALDQLARKYHVRYHRLCPDREGLRAELRRFAPVFAKRDYGAPSRVLVVGLDGDWQQVVMQLIVSSQDHPDAPPNISFVLTEAEAADLESWRAAKPELELVARFEVLPTRREPFAGGRSRGAATDAARRSPSTCTARPRRRATSGFGSSGNCARPASSG